ncbi:MAG: RNA 2',3'-cyclic phosphodiesterase [Candidatus Omnitrophica bacterium]|nr:RNA 2',3'-cyclic phosphodiesterase [Candidatus Omnitrophota bacterium]
MRAFIAIDLSSNIKTSLAKIQSRLKTVLPKISWVKPDNLHLSLKFLGDISLEQCQLIQQAIAEIAKTASPCKIKLEIPGVFPDLRQAKVIWIGADQLPEQLKQLVDQLETKLFKIGFAKEKHPFQIHITLGRIKHSIIAAKLENELKILKNEIPAMDLEFTIRGIILFQSILGPGWPTYSILNESGF